MGISIKGAGITLGGLAAFVVLSKAINSGERVIKKISEDRKWRHYYKYGDHKYATPPGYAMNTFTNPDTGNTTEFDSPEQAEQNRKNKDKENRKPVDLGCFSETLEKIAKAVLKSKGIEMEDTEKENNEPCEPCEEEEDIVEEEEKVETETPKDNISTLFNAGDFDGDDVNDVTGEDEE